MIYTCDILYIYLHIVSMYIYIYIAEPIHKSHNGFFTKVSLYSVPWPRLNLPCTVHCSMVFGRKMLVVNHH